MNKTASILLSSFLLMLVLLSGCAQSSSTGASQSDSDTGEDKIEIDFPKNTIEMIVPYPPGGLTDTFARLLTTKANEYLPNDQTFTVMNHSGGGGVLGVSKVLKARPDGYTIGLTTNGPLTIQTHYDDTPYSVDEFESIMRVTSNADVLVVHENAPWETYEEWLEYVKQNPGEVTMGVTGSGTLSEMVMVEQNMKEEVTTDQVPYEGNGPLLNAILGEQINGAVLSSNAIEEHIEDETLRPLIVNGDEDVIPEILKDVPTFEEKGIPLDTSVFVGVIAPKGVPEDLLQIIHDTLKQAMEDPELKKQAKQRGVPATYADPETFKEQITANYSINGEMLKMLGAKE